MAEYLEDYREFWNRHALHDPLWAILSDPSKRGRKWDLQAFLDTGAREISLLMYQLRSLAIDVARDRALDFGCGVGRLTQPLATCFRHVVGVDVSTEMIRLANDLNTARERVSYVCNDSPHLGMFPTGSFTFVYSNVVLQHIEPPLAQRYLEEFFRVLAPGGVAVFQLPSHARPLQEQVLASTPMSDDAYRASLTIDRVPSEAAPGSEIVVTADVRNDSPAVWDQAASGPLRLGNHWLSSDGRMLIQDDGRALLPPRVEPGASCRLCVTVTVPPDPGDYQLEIDVVHEGITWFADRGSRAFRERVVSGASGQVDDGRELPARSSVAPALRLPDAVVADSPDALPMHGIPRGQVEQVIRDRGGELLHVEPDDRGGKEWAGYRYFARKRGGHE